jgi:hypothetical protein
MFPTRRLAARVPNHQITRSPDHQVQTCSSPRSPNPWNKSSPQLPDGASDQSTESEVIIAKPVPIPPATWKPLTANLMTHDETSAIRETLGDGGDNPDYEAALNLITAHWDTVRKLDEFGMSTHPPRLRKWFPKLPSVQRHGWGL